jgi:putative membrane protein
MKPEADAGFPDATRLAVDRTRLAHERTLMAWVRTATSMISFGFTVYKFFQEMRDRQGVSPAHRLFSPREFALFLITLAVASLVLATLQHRYEMKALEEQYGKLRYSLSVGLAALVSLFGILALVAVVFRQ